MPAVDRVHGTRIGVSYKSMGGRRDVSEQKRVTGGVAIQEATGAQGRFMRVYVGMMSR